ncbi:MAG: hypothetical protein JST79_18370 [Acidobacteria bacterium]|jgi:hypothetical protein|nr:hypothetical protein [Acidobacteriota bacterium]
MKTLGLCLLLMCAVSLWASPQNDSSKGKSANRMITGCLTQGDDADHFVLTSKKGNIWEVSSDSVGLTPHVGHTVTVTGAVEHSTMHNLKEDAKDAAQDTGLKKENVERGQLKVTSLKMVSDSCK